MPSEESGFIAHGFFTTFVMKIDLTIRLAVAACLTIPFVSNLSAAETVPLELEWPLPTLKGTPEDLPSGPNIDPPSDDPPKPLQVPKGVTNVAKGKTVTSSVSPFFGELSQVTDGKKEAFDESEQVAEDWVESGGDVDQFVQEFLSS